MQRSGDIIKLLVTEGKLTVDHLSKIWTGSQRNDESLKLSIYKVLTEISTTLKADSLEFIVKKIAEIPPSKFQKEEIDLMYELTKYTVRAGNASVKACEFFNHAVLISQEYSENVKALCLESYCNILKSWEKAKLRPVVMAQCVECIRVNQSSIQAIKIIQKLLNTFSTTYSSKETPSRNTIISELINDQGALTAFFDNLQNFKALTANKSIESANYKEEIQERLNFLKVLMSECYSIKLSERQLNLLWSLLYKQALNSSEKAVFIKWLSETTENQLSGKKIFEESEIKTLFIEKIQNLNFIEMTSEEFSVVKNCFLLVNLSFGRLKNIYSQIAQNSSEALSEFIYEVITHPISLEGMESLRKIVLDSSEKVSNSASELLYDLYNHISSKLSLKEIREEFLNYLLDSIRKGPLPHKQKSLETLKRFIEESEKDGTGNLKSHNSLLKGDLHSITILNNISYYPYSPDIPKKLELKVYSNITLFALRNIIGKKVKCFYDQFRIFKSFSSIEIKDRENSKTLRNLNFRVNESLTIHRRALNKPKTNLLTSDGKLILKAEKIFRSWFFQFADKGDKMSPEGCAAFTNSCTGDPCKPHERRIQEFFSAYDDDNDGLVTIDNFLKFYTNSCMMKPHTVWNNLTSHHYRHDLRRFDDPDDEENVDLEALPTFILIKDSSNFDLFFSILKENTLANQA